MKKIFLITLSFLLVFSLAACKEKPAPVTDAPAEDAPQVEAPVAPEETPANITEEEPKVEEPAKDDPVAVAPKEEPKVEEPKVETPKVETPKAETPKAEAPKADAQPQSLEISGTTIGAATVDDETETADQDITDYIVEKGETISKNFEAEFAKVSGTSGRCGIMAINDDGFVLCCELVGTKNLSDTMKADMQKVYEGLVPSFKQVLSHFASECSAIKVVEVQFLEEGGAPFASVKVDLK